MLGYACDMPAQGVAELRANIGNLLPNLIQMAQLALLLPSSPGLFTVANVRGKVAENFAAIRALERAGASDLSQLDPEDFLLFDITGNWGLPQPPPSLEDDPSAPDKPFPIWDHDLSEESRALLGDLQPDLGSMSGLRQETLAERAEQKFLEMIDAIFAVGSVPPNERAPHLPRLARTRADFVGHFLAVQMLPTATSTVEALSVEDRKVIHVVLKWAVPAEA